MLINAFKPYSGELKEHFTLELEVLVAAQQSLQPWQAALSLPNRSGEQMKCLNVTGRVSTLGAWKPSFHKTKSAVTSVQKGRQVNLSFVFAQ